MLSDRAKVPVDSVSVPVMRYDTCYARSADGGGVWKLKSPSPLSDNSASGELREVTLSKPVFSREGGFYDEPFLLTLTAGAGERIFYTMDSSEPDENSIEYTEPIQIGDATSRPNVYSAMAQVSSQLLNGSSRYNFALPSYRVDKCSVVRAVAISESGQISPVATASYFVGFDTKRQYDNIPVMSIVSDPDGIFGYERGIYVAGATADSAMKSKGRSNMSDWAAANYRNRGRLWEREASVEYFDEFHTGVFTQQVGIRIKGNWSRSFPQKSLNIYARDIYEGDGRFKAGFFSSKGESSVSLFSGGNDIRYKLEDVLAGRLAEGLNFSLMRAKACFLFLDGEYWGIYYLSQKYSKDYIASRFGVDGDNVVMIKNNELELGLLEDEDLYQSLRYMVYRGLEDSESYRRFCEAVDIESLLDYYAFRIYIGNQNDWPARNSAMWRVRQTSGSPYCDGKWRFMLFDVNNESMALRYINSDTLSLTRQGDLMFDALMKNKEFEALFSKRIEDMSNRCSSSRVRELLEPLREEMARPMGEWYRRFLGSSLSEADFRARADDIQTYFDTRKEYVDKFMKN